MEDWMGRELRVVTHSESPETRIARLKDEHQRLEARLVELDGFVYLTADEQFERKRIQKLKLFKKDMLGQLLREYKS